MRKLKERNILKLLIYLSAIFTVATLVVIVGYIFIKGIKGVTPTFLFSNISPMAVEYSDDSHYSISGNFININATHIRSIISNLFTKIY